MFYHNIAIVVVQFLENVLMGEQTLSMPLLPFCFTYHLSHSFILWKGKWKIREVIFAEESGAGQWQGRDQSSGSHSLSTLCYFFHMCFLLISHTKKSGITNALKYKTATSLPFLHYSSVSKLRAPHLPNSSPATQAFQILLGGTPRVKAISISGYSSTC